MDKLTDVAQWERVAGIIENIANFPRPFTRAEFVMQFGEKFPDKQSANLLNEHICICKDGFIRIRSLTKSLAWLEENLTG